MDGHVVWSFFKPLLIGMLGGGAAFLGLFRFGGQLWLERVKNKYSKELEGIKDQAVQEQKRLQAKIDTAVLVTRSQFETEFNATKQVFEDLAEARLTLFNVRPKMSIQPREATKEHRLAQLKVDMEPFTEAYNKLLKHSETLRPFYPERLYDAVGKCLGACVMEIIEVQTGNELTFTSEWRKQGEKNQQEFMIGFNEAIKIIRDRLEHLAVLPSAQF